ncbi:MAG TPA: hypothetical protein VHP36_07245 [Chitinispirillaceae bacterium]|nr:hypothetical protein [Chitinispirillaceae bacterium]
MAKLFMQADLFDSLGGQPRRNFAAIDAQTGNAIDWNPNPHGVINAIAACQNIVYVGGEFDNIGGVKRRNMAALDASTGKALNWYPDPNGKIYSIAVSQNIVYVGGDFDSIAGKARAEIAALDAQTGELLDWNPDLHFNVSCIEISGNTIYVGGYDPYGSSKCHPYLAQFGEYEPAPIQHYSHERFPSDNQFNFTFTKNGSFQYKLSQKEKVSLQLFDIKGRKIAELLNENQFCGYHSVKLPSDKITSGAFLAVLKIGNSAVKRMSFVIR